MNRYTGAAALTAAVVLPMIVDRGLLEDFSRVFVLILAVLGVHLLTGTTGLISLGHGIFVGIGAFSMANLLDQNIPVVVALVIATAMAGMAGVIVALPSLRVHVGPISL